MVKLIPHHHTGRRMPHHHTSWSALAFMLLLGGVMLMAVTDQSLAVGEAQNPQNGYIGITGTMPGPPPQKAPVILHPTNGQTFTDLPITVDGTCEQGTTVQIFKNDVFAGTANCQDNGSFSLQIDLFDGTNILIARAYDALGQASPASQPVRVTFQLANALNNFVSQVGIPLYIRTDPIARGVKAGRPIEWSIEIGGGKPPYAVSIDWGDGKTELLSRQGTDVLKIEHTYDRGGVYAVVIKATDAAGNKAYLQVLTVVDGAAKRDILQLIGGNLLIAWPVFVIGALMFISFWAGDFYRKKLDSMPKLPQIPT